MVFAIKQEKFEGPLELLLDLIEKEKLAISEVSLSRVTDEYVQHVKLLGEIDPEELAEFLVVAAQLMLLKSRSLLPQLQLSEEEEHSIEELEKRLEVYRAIRERARELKKIELLRQRIFSRDAYEGIESIFYPPKKVTADAIHDIYAAFLAALPKIEKLAEEKIKKIISLEEKIAHIKTFFETNIQKTFSQMVSGTSEKVEVIVSFLAILELMRQKVLRLEQTKPFEDITITRV